MELTQIKSEEDLKKVEKYNNDYYSGAFNGSEATPINMDVAKNIVNLLKKGYTWTENSSGVWRKVDVCPNCHTKYGTNYLYINDKDKKLRIHQTIDEFYGGGVVD